MTLVLELPPDVEAQLTARAREFGVAPAECAIQILRAQLPTEDAESSSALSAQEPEDPTLALLGQWQDEREQMSPDERRRANAEWEELKDALNANRREAGMRVLFP